MCYDQQTQELNQVYSMIDLSIDLFHVKELLIDSLERQPLYQLTILSIKDRRNAVITRVQSDYEGKFTINQRQDQLKIGY